MRAHTLTQNKGVTVLLFGRETQHCDTADIAVVANNEFHSRGEIKLVESYFGLCLRKPPRT